MEELLTSSTQYHMRDWRAQGIDFGHYPVREGLLIPVIRFPCALRFQARCGCGVIFGIYWNTEKRRQLVEHLFEAHVLSVLPSEDL